MARIRRSGLSHVRHSSYISWIVVLTVGLRLRGSILVCAVVPWPILIIVDVRFPPQNSKPPKLLCRNTISLL